MQEKQLQKLALGAEIISAIAVVATILFLVLETRNNTTAIYVQTHLALTEQLNHWRSESSTPEATRIRVKIKNEGRTSLTDEEFSTHLTLRLSLWALYESIFFARISGGLDDNGWERFSANICTNLVRDMNDGIWDPESTSFAVGRTLTQDFRAYIQDNCEQ
jgi:hypothetical protein